MQPDLKAAANKFAVQLLNLLTSRKFWIALLAWLKVYQLYVAGQIDPTVFAAGTVAAAVALIGGIAYEDGQAPPTVDSPKPAA